MIITKIVPHVKFTRHMTIPAQGTFRTNRMKCMRWTVICFYMALHAELVAWEKKFRCMWLMAVSAFHPPAEHFDLDKGSIIKVLFICLSVCKIVFCGWNFRNVIVQKFRTVY